MNKKRLFLASLVPLVLISVIPFTKNSAIMLLFLSVTLIWLIMCFVNILRK